MTIDVITKRHDQADEVEVFGLFGGDLPGLHQNRKLNAEKEWATVLTTHQQVLNSIS
ncbi:hypothetical protein [Paenibacillus ihbetae]|uniref:hypothetical protein n=1 Tax=Paenibacillus ihbetae TaxID=1870820 RepID=UPI00167622F3|nr:hypothetical protein [Paenibacillus ihbetae]